MIAAVSAGCSVRSAGLVRLLGALDEAADRQRDAGAAGEQRDGQQRDAQSEGGLVQREQRESGGAVEHRDSHRQGVSI